LSIFFILFRYVFFRKDGFWGANRYTSPAINAGIRVYPKVGSPSSIIFGTWNNAIYGANLYTVSLSGAEFRDCVCH
jgi:maltose-binding protein MalE